MDLYYPNEPLPPDGAPGFLMYPQFINPEMHKPDCVVPDKLFRFCDCKEATDGSGT